MLSRTLDRFPLLRLMAAILLVGLILAIGLPLVLVAQDSTVVADPTFPTSLRDFLTTYQLPLATVLASALMFLMSHVSAFTKLGDWSKRLAYLIAAVAVTALVKAVGGELSGDLAGWMSAGLGGAIAAGAGMSVFSMAKTQPGHT